jgi:hypothetical protein
VADPHFVLQQSASSDILKVQRYHSVMVFQELTLDIWTALNYFKHFILGATST